jgi:hypothetical protein
VVPVEAFMMTETPTTGIPIDFTFWGNAALSAVITFGALWFLSKL